MKYNELHYANAVARVRSLENKLLSQGDFEKLITCKNTEEFNKNLTDLGINQNLDKELLSTLQLLQTLGADAVLRPLQVKYDYNNLKVLLKCQMTKCDLPHLLVDLGNMPAAALSQCILEDKITTLSHNMQTSIAKAREEFAIKADPQMVDIILDKGAIRDMVSLAEKVPIKEYFELIQILVDTYNIKTFLRLLKVGLLGELLPKTVSSGGTIPCDFYLKNVGVTKEKVDDIFKHTKYDDVENIDKYYYNKVKTAKLSAFGLMPLVWYLTEKELEIKHIRIIRSCIQGGLTPDETRKRSAEYV